MNQVMDQIFTDSEQDLVEIEQDLQRLREEITICDDKIVKLVGIERYEMIIERSELYIQFAMLLRGQSALQELNKNKHNLHEKEAVFEAHGQALEAIIILYHRPVLYLNHQENNYSLQPAARGMGTIANGGAKWQDILAPIVQSGSLFQNAQSTGRIDLLGDHYLPKWVGSGFLAAPTSVVTNRHVLTERDFCRHNEQNQVVWQNKVEPAFNSGAALGEENLRVAFTEVVYMAQPAKEDFALVKIAENNLDALPIHLEPIPLEELKGRLVYAIGYPGPDRSETRATIRNVFSPRGIKNYGKKAIMPGRLHPQKPIDDNGLLQHDCSTVKGTSGCCLIDLQPGPSYGKVIGLNMSGISRVHNYALPTWKFPEAFAAVQT